MLYAEMCMSTNQVTQPQVTDQSLTDHSEMGVTVGKKLTSHMIRASGHLSWSRV
jgi:hypothetical protein